MDPSTDSDEPSSDDQTEPPIKDEYVPIPQDNSLLTISIVAVATIIIGLLAIAGILCYMKKMDRKRQKDFNNAVE